MPDLQALLDQIENSDKYATPGPWESHFGGNPHHEWLSVEPKTGSRTTCTVTDDHIPNAEFIALARTALPQLAKAVYHVLDLLDATERVGKHAYDFGGGKAPSLVSTSEVRKAITDALKGQDND